MNCSPKKPNTMSLPYFARFRARPKGSNWIGLKIWIYGVSRCSEIPQKFQNFSSTKNIFFSSSKFFRTLFSKMFFENFDFF